MEEKHTERGTAPDASAGTSLSILAAKAEASPSLTTTSTATGTLATAPPSHPPATDDHPPGLPKLEYHILSYKGKLSLVVFLLVLESSLLPIALYYGLLFGTTLRSGLIFAVITSFFGLVTGVEFGFRCLKMLLYDPPPESPTDQRPTTTVEGGEQQRKVDTYNGPPWLRWSAGHPDGGTYRPRGGRKWKFDFMHWTLSFGYTVMTGLLIGFSVPHDPLVRPLAVPVPFFLIQIGTQMIWAGWMCWARRPAPFRISTVPKGGRVPPFVMTAVEDVVGVDGGGGRKWRDAMWARYEASARFRRMIAVQNWFWGVGALAVGVGTMVVIWTVPERVAYGVGWGAPLVFVVIWTAITIPWVQRDMRKEKELWMVERQEGIKPPRE